jgi:hypothetical protein
MTEMYISLLSKRLFNRHMNNTQIFDKLVDELRKMHNENLIRILEDNASNDQFDRSFRFHYTQEIEGRGTRGGRIHIRQGHYYDSLSVEHYLTINSSVFELSFPFRDPFVLQHLQETFREWVLHAMTLPHHEREANFQAYIRRRILFYATARRAVAYLPVPKELREHIAGFL